MSENLNIAQIDEPTDYLGVATDYLVAAKMAEETARLERIKWEEYIAALIPTDDIGQKTVTLTNGTKITVKRGLNYKADIQAIEGMSCWSGLSYPAPIKVKMTRELDVKGYEWVRENDPFTFRVISSHVIVTPKKVSVSLKAK